MPIILQGINILFLIDIRAVLIGQHFIDFCPLSPVAHKLEVTLRLPLCEIMKSVDALPVQYQEVYIVLNEERISLPVVLPYCVFVQLSHEVFGPVAELRVAAEAVRFLAFPDVECQLHFTDEWLVNSSLCHSKEMCQ